MNEVDRAEQRRQASEQLAEVMAGSTGTAEHPSRMAMATATATGDLKWLRLHPHALGQGPRAVGQLVVETVRLATDAAVQRGYNELAKSLGDSMAIAIEGFAGPPPFRIAGDAAGRAPYTDAPPPGGGFQGAPGSAFAGPGQHRGGGFQAGDQRSHGGTRPAATGGQPAYGGGQAGGQQPYSGGQVGDQQNYGGGQQPYGGVQPGGQPSYGGARFGDQPSYGGVQPAFRAEDQRSYGGTIEPPVEEQPAPPFAATPPPSPQAGREPRPPVDDDEDAYFADPFGTGGFRR